MQSIEIVNDAVVKNVCAEAAVHYKHETVSGLKNLNKEDDMIAH